MNLKRIGALGLGLALFAATAAADNDRSAYTYVRDTSGEVTVFSSLNGRVEARRNLPIAAGDEVKTDDPGRAEIALADGNVLYIGGGSDVRFESLRGQQGSDDEISALRLEAGAIILAVVGPEDRAAPRVDTDDASVYAGSGARVRVIADPRRGTAVVVRAGSAEVRTRAGSYTVRAGNSLLIQGEEEPELARGSFSRDRFDVWAADRLETTYDAPASASARYVADEYSSDVQALDGYGDWDYNATYSNYVWRPRVAAGWTPYSYGSWYYTPVGLSWWSSDPWGWYPFHYGNWFFDAGWSSWCWYPGNIYSPAWVHWGYAPGWVGWCPVGWYSFYSPWWNNYYHSAGWGYGSTCFAFNGVYRTRAVDFRGWNFTGSRNLGAVNARLDVVPGTRVADRLGTQVAISSRPIVVSSRDGNVREALETHVREAPRVIGRTAAPDASRLEPVLGRQRELPRETVEALRGRTVVAERGRLSGPGASDIAPRGVTVVERPRTAGSGEVRATTDRSGRTVITDRGSAETGGRGRVAGESPRTLQRQSPEAADGWRGRPDARPEVSRGAESGRGRVAPASPGDRSNTGPSDSWRARPRAVPSERAAPARQTSSETIQRGAQSWRQRPEVPPARRVIEGSVPGRRAPEDSPVEPRSRERSGAPTRDYASRGRDAESGPAHREYAPRNDSPRSAPRESAPREQAPRGGGSPAPREAPSAPRSIQRPPSSAPQRAPARPAPSAPSARSAPSSGHGMRSAPAPRGRP